MRIGLKLALSRVDVTRGIRICWPPKGICLEGGCIHCQDRGQLRQISTVAKYADEKGLGEEFAYGLQRNWAKRTYATGAKKRDDG